MRRSRSRNAIQVLADEGSRNTSPKVPDERSLWLVQQPPTRGQDYPADDSGFNLGNLPSLVACCRLPSDLPAVEVRGQRRWERLEYGD